MSKDENPERRRSRSGGSPPNPVGASDWQNSGSSAAQNDDQWPTLRRQSNSNLQFSTSSGGSSSSAGMTSEDQQKHCWVCFATSDDDRSARWVRPCLCRGTTKWVHQLCLQRWVDEKQRGNTFAKVNCSQCQSEYLIFYPPPGFFTLTLEHLERFLGKICPILTGLIASGTVYWCAVTYGAITVFVVLGHDDGLHVMEQTDPVFLLLALPAIPVALFCTQMLKWEDDVLRLLALITMGSENGNLEQQIADQRRLRTNSVTRIFCGALALPLIAKFVGNLLFSDHVHSPLARTLLGGAAFLAARGACNVYFRYQQLWRRRKRVILDYEEPPTGPPPIG